MLFLLLILAYPLMPVAALALGRMSNPTPPRDGTPGPWCAACKYALVGLDETTPCPECGGRERITRPRGVQNVDWWIGACGMAIVLSHAPSLIAGLAGRRPGDGADVVMGGLLLLQALCISAAAACLSFRARPRLMLAGILALTLPQFACEALWVVGAALNSSARRFSTLTWTEVVVPGLLFTPVAFLIFTAAAMLWVRPRPDSMGSGAA